ncbi:hypothetical protein QBC33DRAFT_525795 [Phialemonium atrogriseum]|uniref:Transmembrane protein n=1 Tax=Phialemonium atrogriseum TaxID=1093897 RepID=A0AAJ0FK87_9PEZI|nr:uncharacterized protein QBC33DRAFT_525795 [Phialemonium atrogriseum]KAK1770802.1 hypothetical protein QBC33DRAFT_525795 [Phialemonium atrogriseum]
MERPSDSNPKTLSGEKSMAVATTPLQDGSEEASETATTPAASADILMDSLVRAIVCYEKELLLLSIIISLFAWSWCDWAGCSKCIDLAYIILTGLTILLIGVMQYARKLS